MKRFRRQHRAALHGGHQKRIVICSENENEREKVKLSTEMETAREEADSLGQ